MFFITITLACYFSTTIDLDAELTFKSFINGFRKISDSRNQSELKYILKTSLIILITAESACILTAETIGIIFYNHSIVLSIPLALLVGAFLPFTL
jgi:hypothetical protein